MKGLGDNTVLDEEERRQGAGIDTQANQLQSPAEEARENGRVRDEEKGTKPIEKEDTVTNGCEAEGSDVRESMDVERGERETGHEGSEERASVTAEEQGEGGQEVAGTGEDAAEMEELVAADNAMEELEEMVEEEVVEEVEEEVDEEVEAAVDDMLNFSGPVPFMVLEKPPPSTTLHSIPDPSLSFTLPPLPPWPTLEESQVAEGILPGSGEALTRQLALVLHCDHSLRAAMLEMHCRWALPSAITDPQQEDSAASFALTPTAASPAALDKGDAASCRMDVVDSEAPSLSADSRDLSRVGSDAARSLWAHPQPAMDAWRTAWLVALCAAVDVPLVEDTCAEVRRLVRRCAALRKAVGEEGGAAVVGRGEEVQQLLWRLNALLEIAGGCLGQASDEELGGGIDLQAMEEDMGVEDEQNWFEGKEEGEEGAEEEVEEEEDKDKGGYDDGMAGPELDGALMEGEGGDREATPG